MLDDYKVTRRVGKALTLPTSPAYSFGGRHERTPADPGPGPGQYGTGWGISNKGTGFGTAARDSSWAINQTPAGAAYQPTLSQTAGRKPAYSFGGKPRKDPPTASPGPGAYEPSPAGNLVKPAPNAFTIGPRTVGEREPERSPGPAEYSPLFKPHEVHAASLKFRKGPLPPGEPSPGPGEYGTPRSRRPVSEGKSFGASRPEASRGNGVPGPGEYGAPSLEPHRPRRASWTIGRASRDAGLRTPQGPGPGAYDVTEPLIPRDGGHSTASDHRSPPAYSFGGRQPWAAPQAGPGPSDYGCPSDPGRVTKPVYTLHGAAPKEHDEDVPGPGAYQGQRADELVRGSAPAVSMGLRAYEPPKEAKPGPGAYDPRDGDGRLSVSLKFRNEVRPDNHANPAPHDYANKDFREFGQPYDGSTVRKGFTMRPRYREDKRERVPGPQYAVGCSTLGVAAMPMLEKSKLTASVVL
ncbi:Outer dense fiber protein 3 [Pleodorina starrii]|uniref:Outer dense fiber protein 3 n=1 Tax=Pleodorina starrii TaxID=330485 RepID=A0A9W6BMR5_9CHLO|nr:Outer dense fiber protein 3 [Pleodorina starrii]GLC54833.1 Outer dense fiber protein 3 [Pleodorina starrii]GLC73720.1 Outer dense fiber protein 3 [Pleodorina starrii]